MMRATFSVNQYDQDGDKWDECILLHIGESTAIIRFNDIGDLEEFNASVGRCISEIKGYYS